MRFAVIQQETNKMVNRGVGERLCGVPWCGAAGADKLNRLHVKKVERSQKDHSGNDDGTTCRSKECQGGVNRVSWSQCRGGRCITLSIVEELTDSKLLKNFWRGWFASSSQPRDMIFHCVISAHDEPSPELRIFAL